MSTYATLEQARREVKADAADVSEDARLFENLTYITARIDESVRRWRFEPMVQTREFDYFCVDPVTQELWLDAPLLEATTITDGNGDVLTLWDKQAATRLSAHVATMPLNDTPTNGLVRINGTFWQSVTADNGIGAIRVTGAWGFRRDYAHAWKNSLDALAAGISANATSFAVDNVAGADITGRTPRFSAGQLVKIDSEYFHVTATNDATNTVTVEAAANGTTAAAHLAGATIYTWYPEPVIIRATLRWAGYIHSRRGNFEQLTTDGLGNTTQFPGDMPEEIKNILAQFLPMGAYS